MKKKFEKTPGYSRRGVSDQKWFSMTLSGSYASERIVSEIRKYMATHHRDVEWMSKATAFNLYAVFHFSDAKVLADETLMNKIEEEFVLSAVSK